MAPLPRTAARPPCIGIPLFPARGGWQRLIHGFKYRGAWRTARTLGEWYGRELKASGLYNDVDAVIPLPLHPLKRLRRGYNQSEYIAEGIAAQLGIPVDRTSVYRSRNTAEQALRSRREKSRQRRRGLCRTASRPTRGAARAVDRRCDDHRFDLAGMRRGDTRSSTGLPDQHRCIGRRAPRMGNERISGGAQTPMKMPRQSVVFLFGFSIFHYL